MAALLNVDWAKTEKRVVDQMSLDYVKQQIAARAGAPAGHDKTPVFFAADPDKPPTLQRVHRRTLETLQRGRGPRHGRNARRVIVGKEWLIMHEPELWAIMVALRLNSDNSPTIPTLHKD